MKSIQQTASNETGAALIGVLLLLMLLTVIGLSATTTSTVEQQIAANDKQHRIAMYHTDAGLMAVTKMVNQVVFERTLTASDNIVFTPDLDTVYDQIKYPDSYDYGASDLQYTLGDTTVTMDVHRWATRSEEGGASLEFITGSQSSATGGGGGGVMYYRFTADGQGQQNTRSQLSANYIRPGHNNVGGF